MPSGLPIQGVREAALGAAALLPSVMQSLSQAPPETQADLLRLQSELRPVAPSDKVAFESSTGETTLQAIVAERARPPGLNRSENPVDGRQPRLKLRLLPRSAWLEAQQRLGTRLDVRA